MSKIEEKLRRRWESMPDPLCDKCDGEGKIESFSVIPWHRPPNITCPDCRGAGTFHPSFEDWLEKLPANDADAKEWFGE